MCECLEYEDGDRYQCVVCADIDRGLRAEVARLRAALEPFAEYWRIKTNIRQTPKAGAWHAVASRDGEAELTAEHFAEARAALAATRREGEK